MDVRCLHARSLSKTQLNYFLEFQDKAIKMHFLNARLRQVMVSIRNNLSKNKHQAPYKSCCFFQHPHMVTLRYPWWGHNKLVLRELILRVGAGELVIVMLLFPLESRSHFKPLNRVFSLWLLLASNMMCVLFIMWQWANESDFHTLGTKCNQPKHCCVFFYIVQVFCFV